MAGKQSARRRVSTRTTAPMAPLTRSSHMNQKRCWPGVPNRYRMRSESSETRPKSMATVVVCFSGVLARSSTPTLALVMTASVVSGTISETEPTNVVFPTPKPPATTILTDVIALAATPPSSAALELAKSTEHPFKKVGVGPTVGVGRRHDLQQSLFGHVRHEDPRDTERDSQQRRDLGHGEPVAAQIADGLALGGEGSRLVARRVRRGDQGLQRQCGLRLGTPLGNSVGPHQGTGGTVDRRLLVGVDLAWSWNIRAARACCRRSGGAGGLLPEPRSAP